VLLKYTSVIQSIMRYSLLGNGLVMHVMVLLTAAFVGLSWRCTTTTLVMPLNAYYPILVTKSTYNVRQTFVPPNSPAAQKAELKLSIRVFRRRMPKRVWVGDRFSPPSGSVFKPVIVTRTTNAIPLRRPPSCALVVSPDVSLR
jgi:hypothetical protein